jgi:uncharacterized protein HemX
MEQDQMNQEENVTPENTESEVPQQPNADVGNPMVPSDEKEKPVGPIVGAAIIVAILILGGIYLWATLSSRNVGNMTGAEILSQEDEALKDLQKQGISDSISDIEKDLNNTDISNIDKELENIESELNNL